MKFLILVAKKNILKNILNVFCAHFIMDPDSQSPVWFSDPTYKKCLKESERAIFERSDQVKFAKVLCSTPTMVAPRGSLNSWNQWINDQPLSQSLFPPLCLCGKYLNKLEKLMFRNPILTNFQHYNHSSFGYSYI